MIPGLIAILLAGFIVCGDTRDIPDFTAPACPESQQIQQCGCGNTAMWDQPVILPSQKVIDHYIVERCLVYNCIWENVLTLPATRRWFNHSEERPLAKTGFLYQYRLWSVASDGTRSATASNIIKYRAIPIVCMDELTFKRVPCWSGS